MSRTALAAASSETVTVQTMGGRMHVRWDETAQAKPHGQLVFYAEFLATTGVFERWVEDCPLSDTSPNAGIKRDVLGTLMPGILPAVDVMRIWQEFGRCGRGAGIGDERHRQRGSICRALNRPWVLDLDATIKPLCGRQEGAELGDNPHKPGQPRHVLHTFWIGNLRLALDAVLISGKLHTSGRAEAPLARLLDRLGECAPALVRGGCGCRNDGIIEICEQRELPHLWRLRKKANVKRLIQRLLRRQDGSQASQTTRSLQAIEDGIRLLTNAQYDIAAIGQLDRERCDSVALTCNRWNGHVRGAHPGARREALASRPLPLAAVGRIADHSGRTML